MVDKTRGNSKSVQKDVDMKDQHDEQHEEDDEFDPSLPHVDSLRVECVTGITGIDDPYLRHEYTLDKQSMHSRIDCSNRHCEDGGFRFYGLIQQMAENRRKTKEGKLSCRGKEPRFKGSRNRIHVENPKSCLGHVKYKITIAYKTTEK